MSINEEAKPAALDSLTTPFADLSPTAQRCDEFTRGQTTTERVVGWGGVGCDEVNGVGPGERTRCDVC